VVTDVAGDHVSKSQQRDGSECGAPLGASCFVDLLRQELKHQGKFITTVYVLRATVFDDDETSWMRI
jgi:hypothetical protein